MVSILICGLGRDTPDQVVHGLDGARPAIPRVAFLEVADEQQLFPVTDEKFLNEIVVPRFVQTACDLQLCIFPREDQAFTILDDIGRGACVAFGPVLPDSGRNCGGDT